MDNTVMCGVKGHFRIVDIKNKERVMFKGHYKRERT